ERAAESRLENSMVPVSSTMRPGMNLSVAGLGVASVWMNMVFSGVAGSRPARGLCFNRWRLAAHGQGDAERDKPSIYALHQSLRRQPGYDNPSISASVSAPGTITSGIGNAPT